MGFIYKITNTINNKSYIGQTAKTIEGRWNEHIKESHRPHCEHRPLYQAMAKYGIDAFIIEEVEQVDDSLLSEREMFYIQQYRTYIGFSDCNGYNATLGGDFKTTFEWTVERLEYLVSSYNFGYSCRVIANGLGCCPDLVYAKLKDLGYTVKMRGDNKIVCQLDLDGNLIEVYRSVVEAAAALGNSSKNLHISEVCKGKRKTGGGYRWMYYEDYLETLEN